MADTGVRVLDARAGHDCAGSGTPRLGAPRLSKAGLGKEWSANGIHRGSSPRRARLAGQDIAGCGMPRLGAAWRGKARKGMDGELMVVGMVRLHPSSRVAWQCRALRCAARLGTGKYRTTGSLQGSRPWRPRKARWARPGKALLAWARPGEAWEMERATSRHPGASPGRPR